MKDYRACAATATDARRCRARSALEHLVRFMRYGLKSAEPACPAILNARWRENGTACRCWVSRLAERSRSWARHSPGRQERLRRHRFGEIFIRLVLERRERAERLGRKRDRLAVAVG